MPVVVQLFIALVLSAGIAFSLDRIERGKWFWQEYSAENPFRWSNLLNIF